jgi:hypothetical protein
MNALEEITRRALDAVENSDLESLSAILKERQALLGNITAESVAAYELGEAMRGALSDLKKQIVAEHGRLEQLRRGFGEPEHVTHIQLQG